MSTALLLVLALAGAGAAAAMWMELRAERDLNAELSARLYAASATRVVAPRTETPAAASPVITSPAPKPSPAAPTEPSPQPKVVQESQEDWRAYERRLMKDPKYRDAWREQRRLELAQRRENFIHVLGFTPEQADAAIELTIDRRMKWPGGIPQESFAADERAYQARLREVLGEEKYSRFETYMDSRQSRMQVDRFRTQLSSDEALRDDQVEPLISAVHVEQTQMQKDLREYRDGLASEADMPAASRKYSEREAELLKAAHSRMHTAASGILSSSQLEKFDAMLKRELEKYESQQRLLRIRSKIDPPADPAGGTD
jgi:hypothetical protein